MICRVFCISFFLFFAIVESHAQTETIYSFIPKDYDTIQIAKGDLNRDGIDDIVLALFSKEEKQDSIYSDSIPPRLLIILFKKGTGYVQVAKSSSALLCKYCGGIFGDPFNGILIEKGILKISHYGGSNWRWSYVHKFRFQNHRFYLIGQTSYSYWDVKQCDKLGEFAGTKYEDINFVTGQFKRKRISENCKLLEDSEGKHKVKTLITLSDFFIDN